MCHPFRPTTSTHTHTSSSLRLHASLPTSKHHAILATYGRPRRRRRHAPPARVLDRALAWCDGCVVWEWGGWVGVRDGGREVWGELRARAVSAPAIATCASRTLTPAQSRAATCPAARPHITGTRCGSSSLALTARPTDASWPRAHRAARIYASSHRVQICGVCEGAVSNTCGRDGKSNTPQYSNAGDRADQAIHQPQS
jgi:hypothetical protein